MLTETVFCTQPTTGLSRRYKFIAEYYFKKNIGLQCVQAHFHKSEDKKFDTASPAFVS